MRCFFVVLLAGCAPTLVWDKAGATGWEFEMDRGTCQAQAYGAFQGPVSMQSAMIFNACMRGKGWYLVEQR